jgi:hypothetical protein
MEGLATEWLVIIMNAIVIAVILTIPLLLAIIAMRILRRGVLQDRREFEEEVRTRLEQITLILAEIHEHVGKRESSQ